MKKQNNDFLKVIHSRKSVRNYTAEVVNKDDVVELIKAGMAAPSAVDRRPWAFIAVTERKKLDSLADALPFAKMLKKAGAAIIVCGVLEKSSVIMKTVGIFVPKAYDFWVQDCSAAAENILLAAEAKGLGAVWIGVYPIKRNVDSVRKILGIPEKIIPLNVISIGHPAGKEKPKNKFDPKNIHWEKW